MLARFFLHGIGLTQDGRGSAHRTTPATRLLRGPEISGLQSFSYVQAPTLARPPGHAHRWFAPGQLGRLHRAMNGKLPVPNCGIATCPNRAIDMAGLPPARSRPCRPLHPSTPVHDEQLIEQAKAGRGPNAIAYIPAEGEHLRALAAINVVLCHALAKGADRKLTFDFPTFSGLCGAPRVLGVHATSTTCCAGSLVNTEIAVPRAPSASPSAQT